MTKKQYKKGVIVGAKKVSIFEDPAESNKITGYAKSGEEVEIINDEFYYGANNKPYIIIKTKPFTEGYILSELVDRGEENGQYT